MQDHPFSGSAIVAVDGRGRLRLPSFIQRILERRCHGGGLLVGLHELHPCLIAFDPAHLRRVHAETERRRLREEHDGAGAKHHYARLHRAFGLLEDVQLGAANVLALSPLMRRLGQIDDASFILGAGDTFEIWNPQLAAQNGDEMLRELVGYRLEADLLEAN